jgi:hypothetical protein
MWILPMESDQELPVITLREKAIYQNSLKGSKAKPDATGKPPVKEETAVSSNMLASI